jgi:hypothetical protein
MAMLLLANAGCFWDESKTTLVPSNPFSSTAPVVNHQTARPPVTPASLEAAARVDTLGRKILAANPQIGIRPMFRTIGAPQPEIFHEGTANITLTEGLVKQCSTEPELAAVLCQELGKMVAEREVQAGAMARRPERQPPQDVRIGNDYSGPFGPADQTHLAELGMYEKERRRPGDLIPLPDPQALARIYLKKAGFAEQDLDAAAPQLKAAAGNTAFEKQLGGKLTNESWVK